MTLAIIIPLVCAFAALAELVLIIQWRRNGKVGERVFPILAVASIMTPLLAYALLKYALPEVGAIRVL